MNIQKKFGRNFKIIRISKRLSQGDVSKKLAIDRGYISKLENGRKNPTLQTINKFAKTFNISLTELFK